MNLRGIARKGLIVAGLGLLAAGCSSTPDYGPGYEELLRAREAVARAEQNPDVGAYAAADLLKAQEALGRAEYVWYEEDGDPDDDDIDEAPHLRHYAYLAERYAAVAEAKARSAVSHQAWEAAVEENEALAREVRALTLVEEQAARLRDARLDKLEAEIAALRAKGVTGVTTRQEQGRGLVITLTDVLFDFDQSEVKQAFGIMLGKLASFMNENPNYSVMVEGHTDHIGTEGYNQGLSQRRAEAVAQVLISYGAPALAISTAAYGETRPVASNASEDGRRLNRRVELVVSKN